MCNNYPGPHQSISSSEEKLAKLMNRELGTAISKRELRLFIKAHWTKVSKLAHEIHDSE